MIVSKERYLQALHLLCALPGTPAVYYGDELGMQGMADPWNRAPMDWENGDTAFRSRVAALLRHRLRHPVLQTGYLDVEAPNDDTLVIRRYPVNGLDAFGTPLSEGDARVVITRQTRFRA
jgi:4-alpha-glucanotransferase